MTATVRVLVCLMAMLAACASPTPAQAPDTPFGPRTTPPAEAGVRPGQRAPDFQVTSLDGQPLTAAQVGGGKPYVLYFFATW